jgi:GH15 family glucan-1,4-alpha-glucosidase
MASPDLGVIGDCTIGAPHPPAGAHPLELLRALRRHGRRHRAAPRARGPRLFRQVDADDSGAPENSFLASTFFYIDALAAQGRTAEAREPFENMLACRNHLGLLSGCIDANTNEL